MPASLCLACLFVAGFLLAQGQQTGPADVKVQGPCDVSKKISSPSGDMIAPRCTSNGYYEHQQCLGMQSQSMACWCADPFTGKAIANSIKTPPERPNCSNCILAVAKALHENITAGKFVPTCLESGDYASLQCQGSVSNCWCVNPTTGAELPGTRAKPGSPAPTCDQMSVPTNGGCLQKAAEATGRLGAFVPHCSSAGGHYHTMQCHEAYCFCVDPETGTEAPGTRIQAWEGRNAPCGPCHKRKFEILESRGSEKLPTCLSNGDYDDSSFMRCKALNATYSVCNCIDENGKEIPDTRAIQTPTFKPTCPIPDVTLPIDIRSAPTTVSSLNVSTTISSSPSHSSTSSGSSSSSSSSSSSTTTTRPTTSRFASATTTTDGGKKVTEVNEQKSIDSHPETVTKPTIALPVGHADCSLAKSAGTVCTTGQNKSSTQWYFDPANYDCMAFKHQGCGGNANRFNTVNECWTKCKMPDASGCAGQTAPAKGSDGTMTICRRPEECPTGYTCRMGAFFGTCCETKTEDLYTKNYRPTCKSGSEPVQVEAGGFEMPLLGKSCQDEFCPSGSECVQQEIFAHCCKLDGGKPSPSAEFQADSPTVNADGEKTPEDPYVERDEAQPTSTTSSPSTQKQSSSSSPVQHSPPVVKSPPILQQDVPSSSSTSNTSSSTPLTSESIDAQIATKPEEGSVIDVPPRGRTADCHGEKPAICEDGQLGWYLDKKVGSCVAAMFCSGAAEGNRFDTLPSCEGA
uniref:Uncharacterized protein n=1 Tax=Plectus sambesii TaxID=2011161 RepID=A0A914WVX6_9BILA